MHKIKLQALLGFILALRLATPLEAQEYLSPKAASELPIEKPLMVFSCSLSPQIPIYKILENRYTQAFAALGYRFKMIHTSDARALADARNGAADGDCARIEEFIKLQPQPHLLVVPVLLATTEFSFWSTNAKLKVNSADDLTRQKLRLGIQRGALVAENFIRANGITNPIISSNSNIAIKMLSAKRFDVLINSTDLMRQQLQQIKLRHPIYKIGVLAQYKAYPLLHIKHQALMADFTRELQKLIAPEGIPLE